MTDDERKAVVQRFYDEVVNRGNFDRVDELFSDDFVNHDQNPAFSPGRAGIKELFRHLRTGFPDLHYRVDELLVSGEKVIDRGTATGTHSGPYGPYPPSGRRFEMKEMHIYTVRDGRITERWAVADALKMRQDLGLGLSPPSPAGAEAPQA
ncbi:MAG: ester cyclase [Chloroflexota bacterium]|nr:ester cyclase [Dehalococcoidia bacterium]MDW8252767.1 ester cyclase [Chloroflexota bacterium]